MPGGIDPPRLLSQRRRGHDQAEDTPEDEWERIEWEVGKELGKGNFATAFEMTKLNDGTRWAAKVVSKDSLRQFVSRQHRFDEELAIHASLVAGGVRHPNVLYMDSWFEDDDYVYIVLEICPHESLLELMTARKTLTEYETRYLIKQIVDGMIFCHSRDVLHRDLKPANILLSDGMTVKVADFGYAKQLRTDTERRWSVCGTPNYMPPEVVCVARTGTPTGIGHSKEADVWCIGTAICTIFYPLFHHTTPISPEC